MTIADPKAPRADQADLDKAADRPEDADQWTAKIRTAAVEALPPLHGDPFDRLLIAQAFNEPLRLVTHDRAVAAYGDSIIVF